MIPKNSHKVVEATTIALTALLTLISARTDKCTTDISFLNARRIVVCGERDQVSYMTKSGQETMLQGDFVRAKQLSEDWNAVETTEWVYLLKNDKVLAKTDKIANIKDLYEWKGVFYYYPMSQSYYYRLFSFDLESDSLKFLAGVP